MQNKNIEIIYALSFFKNSWFWLGIWVLFYLRFTNYAGIGILESILIVTMTLTEIPTGAIADLLGKKGTLAISFLLQSVGNIMMALSPDFAFLGFSIFIAAIGGTFYSGTIEALAYDTLKEEGKAEKFDKVISNMSTLQLIAPAVCGIIGGFMYSIKPAFPFLAVGFVYALAFILTFFLHEPKIDTEKFSIQNFFRQTKQGLRQLNQSFDVKKQVLLLLSIGVFVVIADEMLNGIIAVELGFNEKELGILMTIMYIVSAGASQITPYIKKYINETKGLYIIGLLIALSFIISPIAGVLIGGVILILRSSFQAVYWNLKSITINNFTESKYRATTLSTFNMINNIPYVMTAFFVGSLADVYSARNITVSLGFILLGILIIQALLRFKFNLSFVKRFL